MAVPKAMQQTYDEIAELITEYSKANLNDEYEQLCLHALEKLCRKRPSPLLRGRKNTWAAGIVYAIGSNNFIFDRSQKVHTTAKELASAFGVASSTVSAKAADIKKMLKMSRDQVEWCLPSMVGESPWLWTIMVNGLIFDARYLPREVQVEAFAKGLIPYVYADGDEDSEASADSSDL